MTLSTECMGRPVGYHVRKLVSHLKVGIWHKVTGSKKEAVDQIFWLNLENKLVLRGVDQLLFRLQHAVSRAIQESLQGKV